MLPQENTRIFYPSLVAADKVAQANKADDPDWFYVCESADGGNTWSIGIYDEQFIKVGYIG